MLSSKKKGSNPVSARDGQKDAQYAQLSSGRNNSGTDRGDRSSRKAMEKLENKLSSRSKTSKLGNELFSKSETVVMRLSKEEIEEQNVRLDSAVTPHKVEIYIKCRELADLDFTDKSDPYAIMYVKSEKDDKWHKVGETEKVMNCLDPNFTRPFSVNYMFEKNQILRVEVYDYDD